MVSPQVHWHLTFAESSYFMFGLDKIVRTVKVTFTKR
jgi:hypothetical protein